MKVTMYVRPEQLAQLKKCGECYASTFRNHESCFEVQVDLENIDLERAEECMPSYNYYIKL